MTHTPAPAPGTQDRSGRLVARPVPPPGSASPTGLRKLGIADPRDTMLYAPPQYRPDQPMPLVVMLHGAGGDGAGGIQLLRPLADRYGLLLLSPSSHLQTWDAIRGGFGPDIAGIDRALDQVLRSYAIDQERLAIGGFSDGASYALSVGLTNGDLFSHILAFSPGFMAPGAQHGSPRIFIAHGRHDQVLPIDRCSRRIVPSLQGAGYEVSYHEFEGPHTVPLAVALDAIGWLLEAV